MLLYGISVYRQFHTQKKRQKTSVYLTFCPWKLQYMHVKKKKRALKCMKSVHFVEEKDGF